MNKYFAYKGNSNLSDAKKKLVENTKFHLGVDDIAVRRCNRIWGEGKYRLYTFENFNDDNSFVEIKRGN